jgi:hypothetical protein
MSFTGTGVVDDQGLTTATRDLLLVPLHTRPRRLQRDLHGSKVRAPGGGGRGRIRETWVELWPVARKMVSDGARGEWGAR